VINTLEECTVPEKILVAASHLEDQGQTPFSAEALTVASWQKFPKTFGLKGYGDQFPDNNKVLTSIMGEKGLARRGWLVKMGQKLYALTREGRQIVRRMMQDDEAEQPHRPAAVSAPRPDQTKLSRDEERFLQSLFESSAVEKVMEGRKNELNFADASRFWGIIESQYGEALDARVNKVRATLGEIDRHLGAKTGVMSNGRSVSADDIGQLCDIHAYLEERFARQLNLLRNRGEKAPS
jgi:hypothetical protein